MTPEEKAKWGAAVGAVVGGEACGEHARTVSRMVQQFVERGMPQMLFEIFTLVAVRNRN